jgi:hypothetical protein
VYYTYLKSRKFTSHKLKGVFRSKPTAVQVLKNLLFENMNVHYLVHKRPPLEPTLSQRNTLHNFKAYFWKIILILSSHPPFGLRRGLLLGFQLIFRMHFSSLHECCMPKRLILLHLNSQLWLGTVYS